MAPEDPVVNAMLPCDHVHYDRSSGRSTLLGVFDELRAARFPVSTGAYAVYLSLTNMRGAYELDARWLRGDTETEVATLVSAPTIVIDDPLSRVEIALIGDDLPLPEPGRYVLRLRMNGRHVQDYVIIASEAP